MSVFLNLRPDELSPHLRWTKRLPNVDERTLAYAKKELDLIAKAEKAILELRLHRASSLQKIRQEWDEDQITSAVDSRD